MADAPHQEEITRPITLYVSRISFDAQNLKYMERRRITVVDVEISASDTKILMDHLKERMKQNAPGAIRFRLLGRLVIP